MLIIWIHIPIIHSVVKISIYCDAIVKFHFYFFMKSKNGKIWNSLEIFGYPKS